MLYAIIRSAKAKMALNKYLSFLMVNQEFWPVKCEGSEHSLSLMNKRQKRCIELIRKLTEAEPRSHVTSNSYLPTNWKGDLWSKVIANLGWGE